MRKLRVFLVDDHPVVREGLRAFVDSQKDMEVVGEASEGVELGAQVAGSNADVVVMDVAGVGGAHATKDLRASGCEAKVLALSAHEERGYVEQMLAAGACGYVVKRAAAEDLVRAIRCVAEGGTYLDPAVAGSLVSKIAGTNSGPSASGASLSEREIDVLRLIAHGHPLKEIAASLNVGLRSVETYRTRAMDKAGLRSRADIVRYAVQHGWLSG